MIYFVGVLLIFIILIIIPLVTIYIYGKKYILSLDKLPSDCDTVIVLGAGIRTDGKPCDLLSDRIEIAAKVYLNGNCKNILLTGDNRDESRNEVDVMKSWLVKNYLEHTKIEENILLDYLGFCTFDSICRAKNIFNTNNVIISTNKYHLPRAIYISRKMGLKAYGIMSDLREYDRMKKYKGREIIAQLKDYFLVNVEKLFGKC